MVRRRDCCTHALEQCRRFRHRLNAKLLTQDPTAGVVLRDSGLTLARVGEHQHQLAMRFFKPGFLGDQPPRRTDTRSPRAVPQAGGHLRAKRLHVLAAQLLALCEEPDIEIGRAAEGQSGQELTPIQMDGLFEIRRGLQCERRLYPCAENIDIYPRRKGAIERDRLARGTDVVTQVLAQVDEDVAQVLARLVLGAVAGQQRRERLTRICAL